MNNRQRKEAQAYLDAVAEAERLFYCKYGHSQCSLTHHGRCFDETMGQLEADAEEEDAA